MTADDRPVGHSEHCPISCGLPSVPETEWCRSLTVEELSYIRAYEGGCPALLHAPRRGLRLVTP